MKPVPDTPMRSNCCREVFGGQRTRTDVVAPLQVGFLVTHRPEGVGQTDRLALGPIAQIDDVCRGQHRSDLADDSTMGHEDLPVPVSRLRLMLVDEFRLDGFQQGRLIVFDRQQVSLAQSNIALLAQAHTSTSGRVFQLGLNFGWFLVGSCFGIRYSRC